MEKKSEDELLAEEAHQAAKAGRFVTARELIKLIKDPEFKRQATESFRVYTWHDQVASHELSQVRRPPVMTNKFWDHVREGMKDEAAFEELDL